MLLGYLGAVAPDRHPLSDSPKKWIDVTFISALVVLYYTMMSLCVFLLPLNEFEQGEGGSSVQQPSSSPPVSSDHRLDRQRAAQFLREAEKNRRQ